MCLLLCVKLKGGENEFFMIDNGETRLYHVLLAFQFIYGHSDEGGKNGDRSEITWLLVSR